jgi:hypothetical protein
MFDYYFNQWGTFSGVPAISSTLFENLHTFINSSGQALQETPDVYVDNGVPVVMSFTTGWLNLAGLQGYERTYYMLLLGTFYTPHKITLSMAYDYNPSATQVTTITPTNYSAPWGGDTLWGGGSSWGGSDQVEQWRVFLQKQKCESMQINFQEAFDASYGTSPGVGLSLSGISVIFGAKGGIFKFNSAKSVG